LISVKRLKFLFTKKTKELIQHHLVEGFDYSKLRKTDFIDVEAEREKQKNLKEEYEQY